MEFTEEVYKDDRLAMQYIKFGSGKRVLVIIPGLCVRSIMLYARQYVEANYELSEGGYTVYIFDRKEKQTYPYSIEEMADDTIYVLEKLGLYEVYLYGHSQGGMIVEAMLQKKTAIFKKAVLSSTAARVNDNSKRLISNWIECAKSHDIKALYASFMESFFSSRIKEIVRPGMEAEALAVTDSELARFVPNAENILVFDSTARLVDIKTPCFVIGSRNDKVFDYELMKSLADALLAKSFFYEDAGHDASLDKRDFNRRILEFFS